MSDKFKVKDFDVKELGKVQLQENGSFQLVDNGLYNFYEQNGVPEAKKVLQAIKAADNKLVELGVEFLKKPVIERKERCELVARVPEKTIEVQLNAKTENRNPSTNEVIAKYGTAAVKIRHKIPAAMLKEGSVLAKVSAEIEKALK